MSRPTRLMSIAALAALVVVGACASDDAPAASQPATESAPSSDASQESSELDITGAALVQLDDPSADAAVGSTAPVISGQSFDGSAVTIGGPSDGPTLLVFLAHWCPHCNDEIPELNELRDAGSLPPELDIVGISTAVASDRDNYPPSAWIVDKNWTWPVLADSVDSESWQLYGGSGFPFSVLLDADGNVLARRAGSSSAAQIQSWITSVLEPTN